MSRSEPRTLFAYPVLLGDVGGTNARFAWVAEPGRRPLPLPPQLTAEHPGPVEAIRAALAGLDLAAPRSALLAVAAPVSGPAIRLTNATWTLDALGIGWALGLERVTLVNDFAPVAAALPGLEREPAALVRLGPALPLRPGRRLVLGPGTGLGAAALLPVRDSVVIQCTEAGHMDFGPAHPDEARLWPRLDAPGGRVSVECLLSGPGLLRLYRALAAETGLPAPCGMPNDVIEAGARGAEDLALRTLRLFVRLTGRFAGDLALAFGATGGVFIAGGIAPRIVALLAEPGFRDAFERKAPFDGVLRAIPTWAITAPDPAFAGLAALAERFDDFVLDSAGWPA